MATAALVGGGRSTSIEGSTSKAIRDVESMLRISFWCRKRITVSVGCKRSGGICALQIGMGFKRVITRPAGAGTRLDQRSLNINTFNVIYVLMGHALPEEAQSRPVQRAGETQAGVHAQVSNRGETAHSSGSVSFGFAVWPE